MKETDSGSESPRDGSHDEDATLVEDGAKATKNPRAKEKGRKRTKTGCLTCRQRRIKCGEERPTCQNCTKSKRICEGYNQRVVFKDPHTAYRGPPMSSSVPFIESGPSFRQERRPSFQQALSTGPQPIAPRPSGSFGVPIVSQGGPSPSVITPGNDTGHSYDLNIPSAHLQPGSSGPPPLSTSSSERRPSFGFQPPSAHSNFVNSGPSPAPTYFYGQSDTVDRSHIPEPKERYSPQGHASYYSLETVERSKEKTQAYQQIQPGAAQADWSAVPSSTSQVFYHSYPPAPDWSATTSVDAHAPRNAESEATPSAWDNLVPKHENVGHQHLHFHPGQVPILDNAYSIENMRQHHNLDDENDPFDVSDNDDTNMGEPDGEADSEDDNVDMHLKNNDLGVVVALQARHDRVQLRSFTSFIDRPDMLSQYVPSSRSSPLRDPMTARVFCHFINVTGPSLSMFERNPANPSLIFRGEPVPQSQQHIWTYTFPTLALQHPCLLHAMCAIASLHIAKLQNKSTTSSLKHYAYGIRKVARSLNSPTKRGQTSTLAAAMLLAYYEVWGADHQKWSNHLLGACMLVREIDFAGMTRYIKAQKRRQREEAEHSRYQGALSENALYDYAGYSANDNEDVNENLIAILMGKQLRYDEYGHVVDENAFEDESDKVFSQRELETYEIQRDLFWWYCKQDVYQSVLRGGKLFMEYERWSHCPPRAPIGRLNAIYGSFDHLVLLMGRLANFAAKDRKRKKLLVRMQGGYRPPTDPNAPRPAMPPMQLPLMMPGMIPHKEAVFPTGFSPSNTTSPPSPPPAEPDMEALRLEAEEEWQDIRHAFSLLAENFGDDFQALEEGFGANIDSPFGKALQYRTYGIAGLWMNYYMALIVCHRVHPSMPPVAMVAASIAARHTAEYANEIGRIVAGIAPDCSLAAEVSANVGAAMLETGTAIFIAGVQYTNPAQRAWTILWLQDLARLTGWETALAVVIGCESAWTEAAKMGGGPPYVKSQHVSGPMPRWGKEGDEDVNLEGLEKDERARIAHGNGIRDALVALKVDDEQGQSSGWLPRGVI